jgi:hypothetical protein
MTALMNIARCVSGGKVAEMNALPALTRRTTKGSS